jgi:hypothetical protein
MSKIRKTLHNKTEPELAALQVRQLGNTCAFHAIAAAAHLLLDVHLDPMMLAEEINKMWWRGRFMRVFPNWGVTPRMQVRIIRYLAQEKHLPLTAFYQHGEIEGLPLVLSDPNIIPMVTLLWSWKKAPPIYFGSTTRNFNKTNNVGGHTMILAAYDPDHRADDQFTTPWGFINPWYTNADQLFWMREEDFQRAWRFPLPLVGPNPLVLVLKTEYDGSPALRMR